MKPDFSLPKALPTDGAVFALPQKVRRFDPVKALSRYQDAVLVTLWSSLS
jgi:hypothetical protein